MTADRALGAPPGVVRGGTATLGALLGSAHLGPALAVTTLAALLAVAAGHPLRTTVVLTAAVLAGQLTIGWGNDLRDADRDRSVGRADKPLARGEVDPRLVLGCLLVAGVLCVVLSGALGWRSALVHLGPGVLAGHAYNLHLKATPWSWVPYASAFGMLPAVVSLAGPDRAWPSPWLLVAGACLGVGAHLLNVLPDLDDDARTGVRGLPHRLGAGPSRVLAAVLLLAASLAAVLALPGPVPDWAWGVLVAAAALAIVAAVGRGRLPFRAAVAVAMLDVVLLVAAGR
ncbi:MAG: UbiA family prenyltransferase [Nocardioides sp.]|nr:UbiA family prenyltransferase [Nocardioides sp.]